MDCGLIDTLYLYWLVVDLYTPLKNMSSSVGIIIPK